MGFEEFSAPPGSELALPPLFGGHILESELETEVEFVSGGLGSSSLRERDEEEEAARGRRRRQRELNRRKYQALGRRCREIEQVGECGFLFGVPRPECPPPSQALPSRMSLSCIVLPLFCTCDVHGTWSAVSSRSARDSPDQLADASQGPVLNDGGQCEQDAGGTAPSGPQDDLRAGSLAPSRAAGCTHPPLNGCS